MNKSTRESEGFIFFSFPPKYQVLLHSYKSREFTKKSQEEKEKKVGGETAKADERKPLSTCMLSKLIPPSAESSYLVFIRRLNSFSVPENLVGNLIFTSSSCPRRHSED